MRSRCDVLRDRRNWFDSSRGKGYSFIIPDLGGDDVFVHRQRIVNADHLTSGDTVTYEAQMNPRKSWTEANPIWW